MLRLTLAGALAAGALLAPVASAQNIIEECSRENPCYECVTYPCYPSDWPPYLIERATSLCADALKVCNPS